MTPLALVAYYRELEMTKYLLNVEANPNATYGVSCINFLGLHLSHSAYDIYLVVFKEFK